MGKSASGKDTIIRSFRIGFPPSYRFDVYDSSEAGRGDRRSGILFSDEDFLEDCRRSGRLIECRTYDTVYGPWRLFYRG